MCALECFKSLHTWVVVLKRGQVHWRELRFTHVRQEGTNRCRCSAQLNLTPLRVHHHAWQQHSQTLRRTLRHIRSVRENRVDSVQRVVTVHQGKWQKPVVLLVVLYAQRPEAELGPNLSGKSRDAS